LEPADLLAIGLTVLAGVLLLYFLQKPKKLRHPVGIGRQLEERVESQLSQFAFTFDDRRKSSVAATPDFLVSLSNGKIGLEIKNVSELSALSAVHNEKVIQGCKNLDALPLYVVDMDMDYNERQGISVIPIGFLEPVLKMLEKAAPALQFRDEFGVRQSVEELLQFEGRFKILFDKLRRVRDAFKV